MKRGRSTIWTYPVLTQLIDQYGTFGAAAKALNVSSSTLVVAGRREGVKSRLSSSRTVESRDKLGLLRYSGITDDVIADSLRSNEGIAYRAAKDLGVSYALVIQRTRRHPALKQLVGELKGVAR